MQVPKSQSNKPLINQFSREMHTQKPGLHRLAALLLLGLIPAACSEAATAPQVQKPADAAYSSVTYGATLLECPAEVTRSVSATVGAAGGVLELDGHRLSIPLGAVLAPTKFTLTAPASNYVELDVQAGSSGHYQFRKPVQLAISYARCTRDNINRDDLHIYYVDGETKEVIQDLGGFDDKSARVVTSSTDHLSDYALGAPH